MMLGLDNGLGGNLIIFRYVASNWVILRHCALIGFLNISDVVLDADPLNKILINN